MEDQIKQMGEVENMKKLSTAFLIILTVALFLLSTSPNVVAPETVDLGDLDTWVDLNDATATFTPDPALTYQGGGVYTLNVNTPGDRQVDFTIDYTWDDDHADNFGPEGEHTFLLDVFYGGTENQIDFGFADVTSQGGTNGGGTLNATVTGVSVNDVFDIYLVTTAMDWPGTGYDSDDAKIIVTMV